MSEAQIATLVGLPVIIAILASVIAWRTVSRPWLFLVASLLALLGLQGIAAPAATAVFYPSPVSGPLTWDSPFARGLVLSAVLQLAVGGPFLWWLSRGLRKGSAA